MTSVDEYFVRRIPSKYKNEEDISQHKQDVARRSVHACDASALAFPHFSGPGLLSLFYGAQATVL